MGRKRSPGGSKTDRGRWSSQRKMEVVVRILRGEDLDALSRELGVTAARLASWRDEAMAAMTEGLKSRDGDHRDEEIARLREKLGELMMEKELLEHWYNRMDPAHRPPLRRPSK